MYARTFCSFTVFVSIRKDLFLFILSIGNIFLNFAASRGINPETEEAFRALSFTTKSGTFLIRRMKMMVHFVCMSTLHAAPTPLLEHTA